MTGDYTRYDELESILQDKSSEPRKLPLEYLRNITINFSEERLLGEGGFGKVYKGTLQNGTMIAVKKLDHLKPGVQERQFENEVYHLMRLKHPNIVRFLGYCHETQNECVEHNGKYIFAEKQQRLLCLEYLPNGSLDGYLSDGSSGLHWKTRYKIIKGICCGLCYLHEACKSEMNASVIHLDLKSANILLDDNMLPKVSDFGLSRLFEDNKTQTCGTILAGSLGYMAPEYLYGRMITTKADIYSLGVIIIEIITGCKIDPFSFNTANSCKDFAETVLVYWRNRLEVAPSETDCQQIKYCLDIGLRCIKINREERPTSREIIKSLNRWESAHCNANEEETPPANQPNFDGATATTTAHTRVPRRHYDWARGLFGRPLSRVKRIMTRQRSSTSSLKDPTKFKFDIISRQLSGPSSSKEAAGKFTFAQLEAATNDFALEAKIGEGSFGTVYRGRLPDGREVAIKRGGESRPRARRFPERAFRSELAFLLSRYNHRHIISLVGYCEENEERLLVYEYMKNGSLYDHLHPKAATPSTTSPVVSSWRLRVKILLDASRCVWYLHLNANKPPIIHRNIKSSNILLDADWTAHMSGFGLSLMESEAPAHLNVGAPTGPLGYMDPEYYERRHLSVKSDVYALGVVMLEVLTGKRAIFKDAADGCPVSVVDYAVPSIVAGELSKILDPRAPEPAAHETEAVELVAYTAVHCVRLEGKDRPTMDDIVTNLDTALALCEGTSGGGGFGHSSSSASAASLCRPWI